MKRTYWESWSWAVAGCRVMLISQGSHLQKGQLGVRRAAPGQAGPRMGKADRTCPGPAPPAAPPGRWTPAPPPPAAAPCGKRPGGSQQAPAGWGCGTARVRGAGRVRARGRAQRPGKVRGLLPVRRLRFLSGRRHLPARPGSGRASPLPRDASAAGPGRERSAARFIPQRERRRRGSSCLPAGGQQQSLGRGRRQSLRGAGARCRPAGGEVPAEGDSLLLTGLRATTAQRPRPGRWRTTTFWK